MSFCAAATEGGIETVTTVTKKVNLRSAEKRTYIHNLLIHECLDLLPAAVEHQAVDSFRAYLREHLTQNSAATRLRYARYISSRYSKNGVMNLALARFLRYCPDPRARVEVLWFETIRAMPLLRELCESWLAKLPIEGGKREEMVEFLKTRIGERSAAKIASEALKGLNKMGHLRIVKAGKYQPIWNEPPVDALIYALAQIYPDPTIVRMEIFKSSTLWQALLWSQGGLERLINQSGPAGVTSRVTKLDSYYQFALDGTGDERLATRFESWQGGTLSLPPRLRQTVKRLFTVR
jgi:hypothetical protein